MGKYGVTAIRATRLVAQGLAAPEAWTAAARQVLRTVASQQKGCPKGAFLGLCEDGWVLGVPRGEYTRSRDNKAYAVTAVRLLFRDPNWAKLGPAKLWREVMNGSPKSSNHQMDVVLALWNGGLIARPSVLPRFAVSGTQ